MPIDPLRGCFALDDFLSLFIRLASPQQAVAPWHPFLALPVSDICMPHGQ